MDETYVKVRGRWMYLYRAIGSNSDTVEFRFSERRNLRAAERFLRKALNTREGVYAHYPSRWFRRVEMMMSDTLSAADDRLP